MKNKISLTCFLLALLVLFTIQSLNAQFLPNDVNVVRASKRSSVSIEATRSLDSANSVSPSVLGSGVLVLKKGRVYVVTNSHVFHSLPPGNILLVGLNLNRGKIYNTSKLIIDEPKKDIAILAYSENFFWLSHIDTANLNLDQASNGISMFADSASFSEGTSVITIGFPLQIGSEITHNLPIVRRGIVAQGLNADGRFLIDGIASHGNSGSPVFDLNNAKLLGIVAAFQSDFIMAFDENGQIVARLPYNSGLSVCISAFEIWRLLP